MGTCSIWIFSFYTSAESLFRVMIKHHFVSFLQEGLNSNQFGQLLSQEIFVHGERHKTRGEKSTKRPLQSRYHEEGASLMLTVMQVLIGGVISGGNLPMRKLALEADCPNCCSMYLALKVNKPMKELNLRILPHRSRKQAGVPNRRFREGKNPEGTSPNRSP